MTKNNKADLFSFEFYPPKTQQGEVNLEQVHSDLAKLNPDFFSVTFGAGGSTRDKTYDTVIKIQNNGVSAAPHLSCVASTKENIREILSNYREHGVSKIVALRGDLPSGMMSAGEFRYANELVEFIRVETGDHFQIHVAGYPEIHPQANNATDDFDNFKRKVDAGADAVITQYFYNAEAYFYFMDKCEKSGIDIPIVPGIMPITNFSQLFRFSDMCGADIPRWMRKTLECFGDDKASILAFGEDVVSKLCQELLDNGAPGLHFYTMNQSKPTLAVWNNLRF
ncbi:MAG: methylenetetrahydrofolate reductase [NAD(P)H] [Gammaproteobacteria bacterium]|jgi:methylenetetrahydrofolate reductase (NADPH)|uniref:methylenetetrahydrofolate reductase [NAD(P)H] n=1 Tax=Methyloprofundus sp. TaxID=2020875 RepID=UPI0017FD803F|nr:methylenetetrahydrofolate reductase [NAD(P)H] [Methyloprofundus sp.]MBT4147193.1 methylenetetrahydrofolate reductase [NAD(P)H] [Gammaproteobacteria bacterium]HIL77816.1 methylenetetrahydrofolate reductase [NAD(P)H] [Methylococcales bacterium]MBT5825733.1 methylenetetrahydrofolate reductase [NAD(P)H] [Gammaproteobacteria bacterium]MBT5966961.1 methylenetetrahydrofolate reductase [NAD(P)H] [Gammaproteobacteria bacterium]MBT6421016.1 methylenetetrahydrofolate reductase [NAD(P)H] [Gammaproteoba